MDLPTTRQITFGILTVSDTSFRDPSKDASGPEAAGLVTDPTTPPGKYLRGSISCRSIVPDEEPLIMKTLIHWSDSLRVNVILTTGGTGFSKRDVTPEATKRIIDKEIPGITLAMTSASLEITPLAMLSRAVAGIRGKTLIINLPGSPKAVRECLNAIAAAIPHAVAVIVDDKPKIIDDHRKIQNPYSTTQEKLAMDLSDVANRLRQSPYPMISLEEATMIIKSQAQYDVNEIEDIDVGISHGRILAESVTSECNLPPFRASIKDGYAVIAEDGDGPRRVLGGVEAGHVPGSVRLGRGECVRVNTGAPVPDDANAVVQVEDTSLLSAEKEKDETMINILVAPKFDQDIRAIGSDIKVGAKVIEAGMKIGAVEMGILAACGVTRVRVSKLISVGILSTGNELQEPGEIAKPGHVYDSNRITLSAILRENGYHSMDLGMVNDDVHEMIERIEIALCRVDVLITTGSVSMGDKDMLKPILKEIFNATIHFGRVSLKPGKPTTFATCDYRGKKKYFLCLPGNPVSATVTAHLFVLPILHRLTNNRSKPIIVTAKLTTDYNLDPRPEYARAILKWENDDIPDAYITGNQISSKLLSCKKANALLMLPGRRNEKMTMKKDDRVRAMLLSSTFECTELPTN